jgi:deoxyadenosine/deoxycytidine kinase
VGKTLLAGMLAEEAGAGLVAEELDAGRLGAFYADPGGRAWAVELEFLAQRARLLAAGRPEWSRPGPLWTSDFWFHQSPAFARLWLPPGRYEAFRRRWEELRPGVVAPKLTVLLDAPTGELLRRIERRGRPGEARLDAAWLDALREAIRTEASAPDVGPVMRLANDDPQRALGEVLAAVESM